MVQNDDKLKPEEKTSCWTPTWLDGMAAGAVASSLLSVRIHSAWTKISSIFTFLFGPYAALQKRQLRRLGGLRKQQSQLRAEVNDFAVQNEVLQRRLHRLDETVSGLESAETELRLYAKDESQVHRLQFLVERQHQVQAEMKEYLRKQVIHDILQVVVRADRDQDFTISPRELETLVLRCNSIKGVVFHERNFRAQLAAGERSLASIMRIIREVMSDEDSSNDVFTLNPEDLIKERKEIV
jgi:prefoldin subunit 5